MNMVFTQPNFLRAVIRYKKREIWKFRARAHACTNERERERERNLNNVICPLLPQYYHDHSEQ